MRNRKEYFTYCFKLAKIAEQEGESPVGAVIVKDGKIIGKGSEKSKQNKDITRHAEVVAILDAVHKGYDLKDAVLYTNVEPCLLCSYVIRHHALKEVFYLKSCGELGGTQKPYNILTLSGIKSWSEPPKVFKFEN